MLPVSPETFSVVPEVGVTLLTASYTRYPAMPLAPESEAADHTSVAELSVMFVVACGAGAAGAAESILRTVDFVVSSLEPDFHQVIPEGVVASERRELRGIEHPSHPRTMNPTGSTPRRLLSSAAPAGSS